MNKIVFIIGGIGAIGAIIGIISFIIDMIKLRPVRKSVIIFVVFSAILILSLIIRLDDQKDEQIEKAVGYELGYEQEKIVDEEQEPEVIEEPEVVEETKAIEESEEPEEGALSQEDLEKMNLAIMRENFDGLASVEYDTESKTYNLLPTDENLIKEINALTMGDINMVENWDLMVIGLLDMSESIRENLGSGYTINLLNPVNTDKVLLACVDGIKFYDVVDDL